MQQHYETIRELIRQSRRRWRTLSLYQAGVRAALAAAVVVALALLVSALLAHAPLALAALVVAACIAGLAAVAWGFAPLRHSPDDLRVARFVEERVPDLDDRIVSAVDVVTSERYSGSPALAEPMIADAARHASAVDLDAVVSAAALRRAAVRALAAVLVLVALLFVGRDRARQGLDAATLAMFPAHVRLEVTPGNARVRAGTPLTIEARLVGNRAPVTAQLEVADGDRWRKADMKTTADGRFSAPLGSVTAPFRYRVSAGPATSSSYAVSVVRPPRVTRIDVDYTFPAGLGLQPRTEEDSGDIYAPAGTDVRVRIHTDKPAVQGRLALGDGASIPLAPDSAGLVGSLKVTDDNSYRVALADADGLSNPGETEYFIRTLEDRPPEVRIMKPASDRSVTRLEEVDIEAQADDDYGIDRMDLVYAVRGGREQAIPLPVPKHATTVSARHTMYLEDLNVQPGDLVAYYVRARDLTRGKRSSEAKSDIFFLEVKPFDQEFSMAQSQAMAGAGGSKSIDDLVTAQKEIVVATWKLDRRSANAKAKSEQDIRSVGRAEAELKSRVEQASSTFRESTMRDPRRRTARGRPGEPQPPQPSATEALPEEDDMGAAASAMQKAVTSLDALKTNEALPPEMDALNRLLKAQSDVKKRQIARQQSGAGRADNNRNYDLSTLFDKELQRSQQTNYETPNSSEQKEDSSSSLLDKIRDLARRQDELVKRQQELARQRAQMTEEELKRQLEKLTRDQLELRQKAEELSRQMNSQTGGQPKEGRQSSSQQSGQQQSGQQSGQPQAGQQSGQPQAGQPQAGGASGMRSASEEMRNAAGDLRRLDPAQASASGARALQRLRDLERELQQSRPDERRRAIGEMQLEARQLADSQRDIASELEKGARGPAAADALRRLAGDQERLADRVRRLQDGLKQASGAAAGRPGERGDRTDRGAKGAQDAARDAARELERQRLADRMQQAAEQMRQSSSAQGSAAEPEKTGREGAAAGGSSSSATASNSRPSESKGADPRGQAAGQQEIARTLDQLADKLAAATGARDGESQKLSEQLARAQQLRDRLNKLTKEMQSAGQDNRQSAGQRPGSRQSDSQQGATSGPKTPGQTGEPNRGESGGSAGGNDLARLRDEYARQLQQTRELLDQLRRDDPNFNAQHGAGFTFEGQGMTLSAPGTEAFKQDFARWEDLRRQATQALDNAQLALSQKLQAKQARDRLVSGADDRAPAQYRKQVDSYFKAIASKRKPADAESRKPQ